MTDAALSRPRVRLDEHVRQHLGVLLSAFVWLLFVLNFSALSIPGGDSSVQLTFVKRMFGDVPHALGYYFGLALAEAPFYAVGKLLDNAGLHTVAGYRTEETAVALGLGLLTLAAWPLLAAVVRGLGLRHAGFAVLAAALGTPFFFYAVFKPGKNHALDALLFTGAIYLTYRYVRETTPERWLPFALGALFGFAYTVRYFNGAESVALVLVLVVWRRYRHAAELAVTSALVCVLLFTVPWAFGVTVFSGGNYAPENVLVFAPLNPLRMLFTDHRGYFVWSPVALLGLVGLVLLALRRENRRFVAAIGAMGAALAASYALVAFWDGTWSFSQRFYTPLFPLVAIGLAGLLDALPRFTAVAATLAVAWSLFLAFNLVTIGGPQYLSTIPGGADDVALIPSRTHTSVGAYAWGLWHKSNLAP